VKKGKQMAVITVPKVLREKLGEDGADSLVELINLANQTVKEDVIELSGEKFERRLTEEIANLRSEVKEEIANLRTELKDEIKSNTLTMIKWQVGMFITTVILILGLYATIIFK
jgi:molybdopterin converting factor small subunit